MTKARLIVETSKESFLLIKPGNMDNKILDEGFQSNIKITEKAAIKRALKEAGINSFYEHKNGTIIVTKGDAIKLVIHFENNTVVVESKFPAIGNSIQVLASAFLLAVFIFVIAVPFPLQWVIAIIGGQIFSYFFFQSKIKDLKKRIENHLGINYMT